MILAIVGGRDFKDYELVKSILDPNKNKIQKIVSGGAYGADSLGKRYAEDNNIPIKIYYPNWNKYGKAAGMIRNKDIVNNSTHILAFWDGKSKGTKNSIELAKKDEAKKLKIVYY
jgi:hypothetical protein